MERRGCEKGRSSQNFNLKKVITVAAIIILGLTIFVCGVLVEDMQDYITIGYILKALGVAFIVGGFFTAANVFYMQESFKENMSEVVRQVFSEELPNNYKNLRESGICDAVEGIYKTGVYEKIKNAHNCEIIILKMWIPNIVEFETLLYEAVAYRGCTVKVLLISPEAESTIKTRAETITLDRAFIKESIDRNIVNFKKLWDRLTEEEKKRFQFKTHRSFVSVSLIGISGELVVGLYLSGMLSTQGIHYRIVGPSTMNYKIYRDHFESEWENASPYDLSMESLRKVD